jgi:hypothetical protein
VTSSPWAALLLLAVIAAAPLLLRRVKAASPEGVRVVARTALHRNAVVAVLAIGDRRVLVGAGDHGVQLLGDLAATPAGPRPDPALDPSSGLPAGLPAGSSVGAAAAASAELAAGRLGDPTALARATAWLPVGDDVTTTASDHHPTPDRTDAVVVTTSATSDMAAALAALHADADAISIPGPGTGLVDRLRAMTVRTTPTSPLRGAAEVGRLPRAPFRRR